MSTGHAGGWGRRGWYAVETTRAERERTGGPRRSLEERHGDHADYLAAVRAASARLVAERLLLPADAARLVAEARGNRWLPERAADLTPRPPAAIE